MIRISATIPEETLVAADARAAQLDRSRSWVISEALRRYLEEPAQAESPAPGLGSSRFAQLTADLRLTPEERVKEAERTALEFQAAYPAAGRALIVFDSFEEYFEWDRRGMAR